MADWSPWKRLSASPAALRVAVAVALIGGIGLAVVLVSQGGGAFQFWSGVGR